MRIAFIGSRKTPATLCEALEEIAVEFLCHGCFGVSGGADGPDMSLTRAIQRMITDTGLPGATFGTIWLPDERFNGLRHGDLGGACRNAGRERTFVNKAAGLARDVHGGWHNLSKFARKLHARNVYQILGPEIDAPVDYVICAAETTRSGNVKGGTATAVKIATLYGIPIINISQPDGFEKVDELLYQIKQTKEV